MKLENRCFDISPNKTVERDTEGRFFLQDGTGKRKKININRDEARNLLRRPKSNDKGNKSEFIHGSIGEQWLGHKEFLEYGKEFVRMGCNELSRDWERTFGLLPLETHQATAYNFLHGVELGLKAYILFKDERLLPCDLKVNYGHNIKKLLIDAKSKGLEIARCAVVPFDDQSEDENDVLGLPPENNWLVKVFGKASSEGEKRFDIAIGINFERYAVKGTEYPISIYENQEYYYLASIAAMAYTLFNKIRNTDRFFDQRRRNRHCEFDTWLEELHKQRKKYNLSEEEAAEKIGRALAGC